jgi:ribosomal protein S27AE
MSIFKTDRIPSLSRIPKELHREERRCERCGEITEHILYLVPRRRAFLFYSRNHPENVHVTCTQCARSVILSGPEREEALAEANPPPP